MLTLEITFGLMMGAWILRGVYKVSNLYCAIWCDEGLETGPLMQALSLEKLEIMARGEFPFANDSYIQSASATKF